MVKSKGYNAQTRNVFRKKARDKGLKSLRYLMEPFEVGQKVDIILEASIQNGRPHRRYNGSSGTVIEARGQSYVVSLMDGNKKKKIISRPEHLRLSKSV